MGQPLINESIVINPLEVMLNPLIEIGITVNILITVQNLSKNW